MLKIITGKFQNRIIKISSKAKFKPSTTRTREAIFSIIDSWKLDIKLQDANVLDVFCGSGSLGLEALSRGAKYVGFIDNEPANLVQLKHFIAQIDQTQNVGFIHASVQRLPYSNKLYDIVLLDPPYFENLSKITLTNLANNNWLAPNAIIILEVAQREDIELTQDFIEFDRRIYGNNKLVFLKYGKN